MTYRTRWQIMDRTIAIIYVILIYISHRIHYVCTMVAGARKAPSLSVRLVVATTICIQCQGRPSTRHTAHQYALKSIAPASHPPYGILYTQSTHAEQPGKAKLTYQIYNIVVIRLLCCPVLLLSRLYLQLTNKHD